MLQQYFSFRYIILIISALILFVDKFQPDVIIHLTNKYGVQKYATWGDVRIFEESVVDVELQRIHAEGPSSEDFLKAIKNKHVLRSQMKANKRYCVLVDYAKSNPFPYGICATKTQLENSDYNTFIIWAEAKYGNLKHSTSSNLVIAAKYQRNKKGEMVKLQVSGIQGTFEFEQCMENGRDHIDCATITNHLTELGLKATGKYFYYHLENQLNQKHLYILPTRLSQMYLGDFEVEALRDNVDVRITIKPLNENTYGLYVHRQQLKSYKFNIPNLRISPLLQLLILSYICGSAITTNRQTLHTNKDNSNAERMLISPAILAARMGSFPIILLQLMYYLIYDIRMIKILLDMSRENIGNVNSLYAAVYLLYAVLVFYLLALFLAHLVSPIYYCVYLVHHVPLLTTFVATAVTFLTIMMDLISPSVENGLVCVNQPSCTTSGVSCCSNTNEYSSTRIGIVITFAVSALGSAYLVYQVSSTRRKNSSKIVASITKSLSGRTTQHQKGKITCFEYFCAGVDLTLLVSKDSSVRYQLTRKEIPTADKPLEKNQTNTLPGSAAEAKSISPQIETDEHVKRESKRIATAEAILWTGFSQYNNNWLMRTKDLPIAWFYYFLPQAIAETANISLTVWPIVTEKDQSEEGVLVSNVKSAVRVVAPYFKETFGRPGSQRIADLY